MSQTIVRQADSALISWPVLCQAYLKKTPDLKAPWAWQPVAVPPILVGDRYQVTVPATNLMFYRLSNEP